MPNLRTGTATIRSTVRIKTTISYFLESCHNARPRAHMHTEYVSASEIACEPEPTPPTCTPATCDQTGPVVCAVLKSPSAQWPNSFSTAVFGNQCQLTLYNCMNPKRRKFHVQLIGRTVVLKFSFFFFTEYVVSAQRNGACNSRGVTSANRS